MLDKCVEPQLQSLYPERKPNINKDHRIQMSLNVTSVWFSNAQPKVGLWCYEGYGIFLSAKKTTYWQKSSISIGFKMGKLRSKESPGFSWGLAHEVVVIVIRCNAGIINQVFLECKVTKQTCLNQHFLHLPIHTPCMPVCWYKFRI